MEYKFRDYGSPVYIDYWCILLDKVFRQYSVCSINESHLIFLSILVWAPWRFTRSVIRVTAIVFPNAAAHSVFKERCAACVYGFSTWHTFSSSVLKFETIILSMQRLLINLFKISCFLIAMQNIIIECYFSYYRKLTNQ